MNTTEDDQPVGECPDIGVSITVDFNRRVLESRGYAVVKLPDPQQIEDYEDGHWWDVSDYEVGVLNKYPDEVEIVYRGSPSEPITGTNAYDLGIALIAASKIVARA